MTPAATLAVSREFFRGHELCWGNGLPASNGRPNAQIASVVCLAFSIELGLKALLLSSNKNATGHKLKELFELLSLQDQDGVIHKSGLDRQRFEAQLGHASGAFVEWRYIHEKQGLHSVSLQFLLLLRSAVDALAEEKAQEVRRQLRGASE